MTEFLIMVSLSCPEPKLLNTTKEPWNDFDRSELKYAQKRCGEYYKDAPCVKLFKKYAHKQYSAICGAKK